MCASCSGKIGLSWGKNFLLAAPVPVALAAGFLVPSGEDRLLLWVLGTAAMFACYFYWVLNARPTAASRESDRRA